MRITVGNGTWTTSAPTLASANEIKVALEEQTGKKWSVYKSMEHGAPKFMVVPVNLADDENPVLYDHKVFKPDDEYHYFVTSALNWVVDVDLVKACNRLKKVDGHHFEPRNTAVFRVPGPASATYEINHFMPCVPNTVLIGNCRA